jgi:hypothetical protein
LGSVRPLTTQFFLPPASLLMMSPIRSLIMPYFLMIFLTIVFTLILHIIRVTRNCQSHQVASGLKRGLIISFITSGFSLLGYALTIMFPVLLLPFISISILPWSTLIGESFYLTLIGCLGYAISQLFLPLCP